MPHRPLLALVSAAALVPAAVAAAPAAASAPTTRSAHAGTSTATPRAARSSVCSRRFSGTERYGRRTIPRFTPVASTDRLVVYATGINSFGDRHYVCWRATGAVHAVATNSGGAAVTDAFPDEWTADGAYLAYRVASRGDLDADRFVVRNGRTGRIVRDTGQQAVPDGDRAQEGTLVLLSGRRIVWSSAGRVQLTDAAGDHPLAAAGTGPVSRLRVSGSTVRWRQDGRTQEARLP